MTVGAANFTTRLLDLVLGAGRVLSFAGVAAVVGLLVVGGQRGATVPSLQRMRTAWLAGAGVGVLGSLIVLVLRVPSEANAGWAGVVDVHLASISLRSAGGAATAVRVVLLVVLLALGLRSLSRTRPVASTVWANAAALAVVALASTFAVGGHESESDQPVLTVALASVHALSVAAWFGGVAALLVVGIERDDVLRRFSRLATWLVPSALISGAATTIVVVGGPASIGDNDYTRWLLVKVLIVGIALAMAAATRLAMRSSRSSAMARGMVAELVVGCLALGATAALVANDPREGPDAVAVVRTLTSEGMLALVEIDDARTGTTVIHVYLTPAGGSLETVPSLGGSLSPSGTGAGSGIALDFVPSGPNHWAAVVAIPAPGLWTLVLAATPGTSGEVGFVTALTITD